MRLFFLLFGISILFSLSPARGDGAAVPDNLPPVPSAFDSQPPAPAALPPALLIPANTHLEIKVWRKHPFAPPATPQPNDPRLLWAPDLKSAIIERNQKDIHALFQWEGGHSSEAYIINGTTFSQATFAYPDQITTSNTPLSLFLNRPGGGDVNGFPGLAWYLPIDYAGTAVLNKNPVLVFAVGAAPGGTAYPAGISACLDAKTLLPVWLDDGTFIYTFASSPAANVRIDPQGPFLKAIEQANH